MIIEILLGISVISNLVLLYGVRNLLKQNEQLEDTLSEVVLNTTQTLTDTLEEMKRIDLRGSFESDDEVGFIFKEIKNTIKQLDRFKGEQS